MLRISQLKTGMLRPLRIKLIVVQLCAAEVFSAILRDPKKILHNFARLKNDLLRL